MKKKLIEDVQEDVFPATEEVNNIFESFHKKLTEIIDNFKLFNSTVIEVEGTKLTTSKAIANAFND